MEGEIKELKREITDHEKRVFTYDMELENMIRINAM